MYIYVHRAHIYIYCGLAQITAFWQQPCLQGFWCFGSLFGVHDAHSASTTTVEAAQLRFIRDSKTKGRAAIKVFQGTNQS